MKKTFEYDQTKYDPNAPTRTEQFLTADGVKTLTTDANDGAVLIQDSVDGDSLNPVTAAAVATAIEQGGGGGGVPDVADPLYVNPDDAVALRFGSGMRLEEGDFGQDDTLAVALSGTGGLYYDEMEENALAVQLDPDGAIENFIDDGEQVGLRVKVDGTSIDINASGQLAAVGGGGGTLSFTYSNIDLSAQTVSLPASLPSGLSRWLVHAFIVFDETVPAKSWMVTGTPVTLHGHTDVGYNICLLSGSVGMAGNVSSILMTGTMTLNSTDTLIESLDIYDASGNNIRADLIDIGARIVRLEMWQLS